MSITDKLLEQGKGVLRLAPTWLPRKMNRPGRRLKLHPEDIWTLGIERGGISHRWLSSTIWSDNGPLAPSDEGLSYVVSEDGEEKITLYEMVESLKGDLIGEALWNKYHGWPMFSKFFDNVNPLPLHLHQGEATATLVNAPGKPEMYFFPAQLNNYVGEFPHTYFGINPEVTKDDVKECLMNFEKGDNNILSLSKAYKMELDTGWDVPAGILHAPGSLVVYEPCVASGAMAHWQSVTQGDHVTPSYLLWAYSPEEEIGNYDYLLEIIDWELNYDPEFKKNRFMKPRIIEENTAYTDEWIGYKCPLVSAKRLTINPGQTCTIKDGGAYGCILIQGRGIFGVWDAETPTLIRYGQLTSDEFFVSDEAASRGVTVTNTSKTEPFVMLKHFAENRSLVI